ncbi:MAG: helix-turn-helix domain-containing protein, partial [Planctomycetia bacterium]
PATPVSDIGSQQTVGLESVLMLDDGDPAAPAAADPLEGTVAITEASLRQLSIPTGDASPAAVRIGSFVAETATLRLEDWQRILVVEALRRTGGSVPNAAAELGISRATLYRKLELYGLTRDA